MRTVLWCFTLAAAVGVGTSPGRADTYVVHRIASSPQPGYADAHVAKAVLPSERTRVWWAMMLNPDCSLAGTMTTEIVEQPRHGQATVTDDPFFPNYVAPNPRAVCDSQKALGKEAFYTADAGFKGHDKLVLRNATSEGRIRRIIIDIDVR